MTLNLMGRLAEDDELLDPDQAVRVVTQVRGVVTRQAHDPRLVERVSVTPHPDFPQWVCRVYLRDGRVGEVTRAVGDPSFVNDHGLVKAMMEAAGMAFGQPPILGTEFARDGLASDGWWREVGQGRANEMRTWVKRLLLFPQMTNAHADRFIASLDPIKRQELERRVASGASTEGF